MTYDHLLKTIFQCDETAPLLFPGRLALPLFAFIIARHLAEKQIFSKYLQRLLPFALLTIPVDFYFYETLLPLNIMFTFMISVFITFVISRSKKTFSRIAALAACILISLAVDRIVEYGFLGVWLIPIFYWLAVKPNLFAAFLLLSILALCFVCACAHKEVAPRLPGEGIHHAHPPGTQKGSGGTHREQDIHLPGRGKPSRALGRHRLLAQLGIQFEKAERL